MRKDTKRQGFNFLRSYFDVLNEIPENEDKLAFLLAVINKQFCDEDPKDLNLIVKLSYESQRHAIEKSVKGYKDKKKTDLLGNPLRDPKQDPCQGGTEGPKQGPCQQEQEKGKEEEQEQEEVKEKPNVEKKLFSPEVINTTRRLTSFFDDSLKPDTPKKENLWLDTVDKLNRIDKLPFELIEKITEAARNDDFWSSNFLSVTKLRKKNKDGVPYFKQFYFKFLHNGNNKPNSKQGRGVTEQELAEILDDHFKKQRNAPRD